MKKTVIIIILGILAIASISTVMSSSGWGDRDEDERHEAGSESEDHESSFSQSGWLGAPADVRPVQHAAYRNECGSCHFAYQPGLLSQQAWERVMATLDEHYGDDASLDEEQAADIRRYLLDNAADRASQSRSRAFANGSATGNALPRITKTSYFQREHYEIPARFVPQNGEVGSFSNCQACHRSADDGIYDEHQVVLPGVGRWDD